MRQKAAFSVFASNRMHSRQVWNLPHGRGMAWGMVWFKDGLVQGLLTWGGSEMTVTGF
jgi:hypothetical protein